MTRLFCLLAALFCINYPVQAASLNFPELTGRVVDQAHVLPSDVAASLDTQLANFEQQTGRQIVVVTLDDLGDNEIADYTYQLGRHWQIGQAGKNDGVIILVVPSSRQARIEAGYGVEGDLTDATSSLIINNVMIPHFKEKDWAGGILAGTQAVMSVIQEGGAPTALKGQNRAEDHQLKYFLIAFLILWVFSKLFRGRSSGGLAPFLLGSLLNSRGGGFGGGFGGGGGFSGGGGSFGGGGASGRW